VPKSRSQIAAVSTRPTPRLALSIREFCQAHGISEAFFYKLKKQGEGPREMKVGARTLITFESAAEWRRIRENQQSRGARDVRFDDRPAADTVRSDGRVSKGTPKC
jgi:predicted DNA-binding transcriptional regulator AlpA